jgi:hypothetical protein
MTRRAIDGELLKFLKGDFEAGKDDRVVPVGTELVAIMDSLAIGWMKWKGGKPSDYRMGLLVDGFQPPRRSELDELESDTWEVDKSGDLKDPWAFTNMIVLIDPKTKEIYTFSTSTRGGLDAIGKLCKDHAKKSPKGAYPIVTLQVGSYQHSDKTIGKVKYPAFEVGKMFVSAEDFDATLSASRGEAEELPAPDEDALAAIEAPGAPAPTEYDGPDAFDNADFS